MSLAKSKCCGNGGTLGCGGRGPKTTCVIGCCCPQEISSYEYWGTSLAGQVPKLPYVLTDTITTGFTTWTTRFRFHYTVLLVFL